VISKVESVVNYVVLSRFRVSAGCSVRQQDDVFRRGRPAAAADNEHVIVQPLKPGGHVGAGQSALLYPTYHGQDVSSRHEPEHIASLRLWLKLES